MKPFLEQARFYAQYHQQAATFYTHLVGVPILIFAVMIFLGFFHLRMPNVFDATLASIATLILWLYYLRLNWRLSLLLLPVLALLLWISSMISYAGPTRSALWLFVIFLVLGVVLQLSGHFIEGRKPAFMDNMKQALIAPLYLTAELCFMAGFMKSLQETLHGGEETRSSEDKEIEDTTPKTKARGRKKKSGKDSIS
ncbi:Mpo1 family 2-hydroxy fatty acid dioxygenase [Legionella spiritensis]|uniref:Mpo1 family 2-hydroxy fatty acid dioxygenase n=1 Tax=Legionella spiritensis TaxID=452 RepID=UPI000F6BF9AE|nr:Mpo1-like protein [Legionella spiritensis]VEG91608.1 transmembrane protein [Legionella spiritensis]